MFKSRGARVAGFVGTMGLSVGLLGAAASSTGAYFTDSESGTMTGTTGALSVDKRNSYDLTFNKMIPGEYQAKEIKYRTGGDTPTDIWLHFPDGAGYGALTGESGYPAFPDGGLGRYGHLAVANNDGGTLFSSWNLANASAGVSGCADANGHGSNQPPANRAATPPYCGVPHYMKIESNVPAGTDAKITLTFGVTGRMTAQNSPQLNAPFEVVATQPGIRPDAENF